MNNQANPTNWRRPTPAAPLTPRTALSVANQLRSSTPPARPRDTHFWSYGNAVQAHTSFNNSHYAQNNPVQAWRQEDIDEVRNNNRLLFQSYDHTTLGLQQRHWNSFWNDLTTHFRSTVLRVENRVVQHYENNILATTRQPLLEAKQRYRESFQALQAENRKVNDKNEELVNLNILMEGNLFDMKKKIDKEVQKTDYYKAEVERLLKQNAEIAKDYCRLQTENTELKHKIETGVVVSSKQYVQDEDGYICIPNSVEVQVGKSFINQNNEVLKRQDEDMIRREKYKRKKEKQLKTLLLADSSEDEPVAKILKKKEVKSKIISARKSLAAMKTFNKKPKTPTLSRKPVVLSPVKSIIELKTSGYIPMRGALGDKGIYINLETGGVAVCSQPASSLPEGIRWYTRNCKSTISLLAKPARNQKAAGSFNLALFAAKTYTQADNVNWKVTQLEQSMDFKFENLKIEEIPNLRGKLKPSHIDHYNLKADEEITEMFNWQGEAQPPYYVTTKGNIIYTSGKFVCKVSDFNPPGKKHTPLGSIFGRVETLVWFVVKAFIMSEAPEHNKEYYEVMYKDNDPRNMDPLNLEVYYPSKSLVLQAWTRPNDAYKKLMK